MMLVSASSIADTSRHQLPKRRHRCRLRPLNLRLPLPHLGSRSLQGALCALQNEFGPVDLIGWQLAAENSLPRVNRHEAQLGDLGDKRAHLARHAASLEPEIGNHAATLAPPKALQLVAAIGLVLVNHRVSMVLSVEQIKNAPSSPGKRMGKLARSALGKSTLIEIITFLALPAVLLS